MASTAVSVSSKMEMSKLKGIDLTKVPPINQKRMLAFINHFIVTTVSFLNKFAQSCESRLEKCHQKMLKLEAEICILEDKLNSIPGLDAEPKVPTTLPPVQVTESPTIPLSDTIQPQEIIDTKESAKEETCESQNPLLTRYRKMLAVGVPLEAVRLKMRSEGCDPSLLS